MTDHHGNIIREYDKVYSVYRSAHGLERLGPLLFLHLNWGILDHTFPLFLHEKDRDDYYFNIKECNKNEQFILDKLQDLVAEMDRITKQNRNT